MSRKKHEESGRVYACPECDSAGDVYQRTHREKEYDHEFRCHSCSHLFDEPVDRPTKTYHATGAGGPTDDDGLPATLAPRAKQLIRQRWAAAGGNDD